MGKPLVIVGHGLIERQVLGPATADGPPTPRIITLRRYRCRACKAIPVVGPRGIVERRWYGAGAIALAFAVVAHGGTSREARERTSPSRAVGASAAERWTALDRWIEAARRGDLFGVAGLGGFPRRRVAEQVVLALAARGGRPLGADLAASAFAGASTAFWRPPDRGRIDLAEGHPRRAGREGQRPPAREAARDPPRRIGHAGRPRRHDASAGDERPAKEK